MEDHINHFQFYTDPGFLGSLVPNDNMMTTNQQTERFSNASGSTNPPPPVPLWYPIPPAGNVVTGAPPQGLQPVESGEAVSATSRNAGFRGELVSIMQQQLLESENLRKRVLEMRQKHFNDLLSMLEKQTSKILMEKETKLENIRRMNVNLEARVSLAVAEKQMLLNMVRNNEAAAANLRASLEQALDAANRREGFDDSHPAAESSCAGEDRGRCKMCRKNEVCVLLLPCRHLCLCGDCQPNVDKCPICDLPTNAYLNVITC
ncbi:putative BOI-related E3 ubiquitin-protein ligase 2 isoform X2 [Canna indica]|uniref:BOI-related E3 ubiquitin-protein ligase 2 isoform X2 n=1 Tax=Canna indica TaxID=4628 RepID=A0AAQ3K2R6_9LILI|nr:putative BOI-related E3 ubiquitin-protein ligase 2 isoform X2 [Canna indica]